MKGKETFIFVVVLLAGTIFGSILGDWLGNWLPILKVSKPVTWSPAADLEIIKYDLDFTLKLNLASIGGLALAFWIYRRMK